MDLSLLVDDLESPRKKMKIENLLSAVTDMDSLPSCMDTHTFLTYERPLITDRQVATQIIKQPITMDSEPDSSEYDTVEEAEEPGDPASDSLAHPGSPVENDSNMELLLQKPEGPQWERRYKDLSDFYRNNSHCRVTEKFNKSLHYFVQDQRKFRRKGKLSASRIAKLDAISFEWNPNNKYIPNVAVQPKYEERWNVFYEKLKMLKTATGSLQVPKSLDPSLYRWLNRQRVHMQSGSLSEERKSKLESLGVKPASESIAQNLSLFQQLISHVVNDVPADTTIIE